MILYSTSTLAWHPSYGSGFVNLHSFTLPAGFFERSNQVLKVYARFTTGDDLMNRYALTIGYLGMNHESNPVLSSATPMVVGGDYGGINNANVESFARIARVSPMAINYQGWIRWTDAPSLPLTNLPREITNLNFQNAITVAAQTYITSSPDNKVACVYFEVEDATGAPSGGGSNEMTREQAIYLATSQLASTATGSNLDDPLWVDHAIRQAKALWDKVVTSKRLQEGADDGD